MEMSLAPWVLAISQDGNQERSSDSNVDKEKVLLRSVHKGTNAVKKKKQVVPQGKLGRGLLRVLSWGKAMSRHVKGEVSWHMSSVARGLFMCGISMSQ